jgi:hypothetical protein
MMSKPVKQWLKPPLGWVKLTCDGSVKVDDGTVGLEWSFVTTMGVLFSVLLVNYSPVTTPSKQNLRHVKKVYGWLYSGDKPIIMESDWFSLVSAVQKRSSLLLHLVEEIKLLMNGDRNISFVKVDRSQVRVSHCLAKFARAEAQTDMWLGSGPEYVLEVLELDLLVTHPA